MCLFPPLDPLPSTESSENIEGSVEGKIGFPLQAAPFLSYFHFELSFNFPYRCLSQLTLTWTQPELKFTSECGCVPHANSPLTPLSLFLVSLYISLSPLTPLLPSERVDFSRAGNETALPCDSQQERGDPGRERGRGSRS